MKISVAILAKGRADHDAQLTLTIESQVTQCACIWPAADRFQFVNDFHCSKFGRTRDASTWKTGSQCSKMAHVGAKPAFDGGNQMLHLGVTLEPHEFRDLDCAIFADLAQIVSQQLS